MNATNFWLLSPLWIYVTNGVKLLKLNANICGFTEHVFPCPIITFISNVEMCFSTQWPARWLHNFHKAVKWLKLELSFRGFLNLNILTKQKILQVLQYKIHAKIAKLHFCLYWCFCANSKSFNFAKKISFKIQKTNEQKNS